MKVPSRRLVTSPARRSFDRCWLTAVGLVPARSARQATEVSPCISAQRMFSRVGSASMRSASAARRTSSGCGMSKPSIPLCTSSRYRPGRLAGNLRRCEGTVDRVTASATSARSPIQAVTPARRRSVFWSLTEVRWAAGALALFVLGGIAQVSGAPAPAYWALYLACFAVGGWEPAWSGIQALREKTLDVDLLMVVAAIGAASIGQVFDGALLIVIFATSGALEAFATRRTEDSVRALLDLTPDRATRVAGDGTETEVQAADLAVQDRIVGRPGERIGADGRVVDGLTEGDQASITGEPMPVTKGVGDEVFAGTINGTGAITVEVTRAAHQTLVARIVAQVAVASATKARTQLFIDKV